MSQSLAFFLGAAGYQEECRKPSWLPCPWLRHGQGSCDRSSRCTSSICLPCVCRGYEHARSLLALFLLERSLKDAKRPTGALGRKAGLLAGPLGRGCMLFWGSPWLGLGTITGFEKLHEISVGSSSPDGGSLGSY